MKFKKLKPGDEKQTVFASFNVAEIKTLFNALSLDMAGDVATGGTANQDKTALLQRLEKLIPE